MSVRLINPANHSFGVATITPRWLYVIAGATPPEFGDPILVDEVLHAIDADAISAGDVIGIGVHTSNALRGYEVGRLAARRGAYVVYGGIHATLYPEEPFEHGAAETVITGDGELAWGQFLRDHARGAPRRLYEGGRVPGQAQSPARWDLVPPARYLAGCVQTVRGCPKHCSFCSVWRTDGRQPRQRPHDAVVSEIRTLRKRGFRVVLLADDNFYPVTFDDVRRATERGDAARVEELHALRQERLNLLHAMAQLPRDMIFFTQITMEAAEDAEFLEAMRRAGVTFVLVGVESVSEQGLKAVGKEFNAVGDALVERLRTFPRHGVHVLGSFIFGLPTDGPDVFERTVDVAERAEVSFAQFLRLTPFPGTVDFMRWEKQIRSERGTSDAVSLTRYWLLPFADRPKVQIAHRSLSTDELLAHTRAAWARFYAIRSTWRRSRVVSSLRARVLFVLASKLFAHMYFHTGAASDSARATGNAWWSGQLARLSRHLISRYAVSAGGDMRSP